MYNLMIGPPGGGKSYESVVYHVLPTLEAGRKVITNLPLNVAEFALIDQRFASLIEIRTKTKAPTPTDPKLLEKWNPNVFSHIQDYGDDWRNPQNGQGPLYVIDEAHKALPRALTDRKVEEWFAEHRHEGADVLLITQSHGKISKAITDSAQVVYRVRKMTAFGDNTKYIRKVQDGTRGDVLSIAERSYESKYYRLYKSHTRTVGSIMEADAKDISPRFKKFLRAAYACFAFGGAIFAFQAYGYLQGDDEPKQAPAGAARSGAPSTAAAPAGAPLGAVPPQGMQQLKSTTKRIVGVVLAGSASHVILYTKDGDIRHPLTGCEKQTYAGWKCEIEGEIVTENTGPKPIHETPGLLAPLGIQIPT